MLIGQTIGPFLVESELGSGAMGTVFKARFTKEAGKVVPVALKVVALGLLGNEGAMARFEREASILKQLRHPHIVRLLATGRYRSTPFIAMEFVAGESLEKTLARRARLDWVEVVSYGKQLCDALQHAHDKGIVHRDLKPSNFMVTHGGTLKLTDFGIAKDTDVTALTGANSTIGTAAYMSPEQCRGDKTLGPKSDLYSLGVCLYELLTGVKPFTAESTVDLFLKHVNETPARPRRLAPETPVWLDNLVMFCLEKNKESRPLDAATVGRMLGEIEEKVRTNQSVGEEVANARRIDRPVGKVADADKDAARQLRSGPGKKKRKKKQAAEAKPPWKLAVLAMVPIVLLLGYAGYSLLPQGKPPETPEQAFARVSALEGDPDARVQALKAFLSDAPPGPLADQARGLLRAAYADRTESAVVKRFNSTVLRNNSEGFVKTAYEFATQALEAEDKGRVGQALDLWRQCRADCPAGPGGDALPAGDELLSVSLGWVADRRVRAIQSELPALQKRLEAKIAEDRLYELDPPADDAPDALATRAILAERLGDKVKARANWDLLATRAKGEPGKSAHALLAQRQSAANRTDAEPSAEARAAAVGKLLSEAEARTAQDFPAAALRDLRNDCRAVVALYGNESDPAFTKLVGRARELLAKHAKS